MADRRQVLPLRLPIWIPLPTDPQIFLSSLECQEIVSALWKGSLVQRYEGDDIDYVPYNAGEDAGAFGYHFDPQRLAVPRYQTVILISVWLFYIFVYSQVVRRWV